MTTPAAAARYISHHLGVVGGRAPAVYNPYNKPVEKLPAIYGFNNGGQPGWLHAQLLAEDGTALGSHACSAEDYMPHDLGVLGGSRPDRHETFRKHYPNGYRMEFVPASKVRSHAGLMAAYECNQKQRKDKENSE